MTTTSTTPFAPSLTSMPERSPELSIVMPCLNEADTIAICIEKAQRAIGEHGIAAEIVIADNGSTDGSQEIARRHGARVIAVDERGYGAALMGGINAARGEYVICLLYTSDAADDLLCVDLGGRRIIK